MRPTRKSTLTLFVAGVVLLVLSASGQPNQFWESGPSWLGLIGWIGFLICLLLLVVSGVYWVVSRIRQRDRPSSL
jgi:drug/metabolite transporter (DMT)-like permease